MEPSTQALTQRIYPSYMTPRLIKVVETYEDYDRRGIIPSCPLHRVVSPREYVVLQRYWNEGQRIMRMGNWVTDPFA